MALRSHPIFVLNSLKIRGLIPPQIRNLQHRLIKLFSLLYLSCYYIFILIKVRIDRCTKKMTFPRINRNSKIIHTILFLIQEYA